MAEVVTDTKLIKLYREGTDSAEIDYDASNCSNIAALKGVLNCTGMTVAVNGVIVQNDNLPLNENDRVSFTGSNKTGG